VARDRPALVLLDVGLPDEDGFTIARWLRESTARVGIIMVTVASDTVDHDIAPHTEEM
jgi:two-component system phosphate regulon response regulator OmpR